MSDYGQDGAAPPPRRWARRLLAYRYWIYGAVILGLLGFRVGPQLLRSLRGSQTDQRRPENLLVLAGLDLAPALIPKLAETYRSLYPEIELRIQPGGTRQALEDLFNRRADIAFLSRPMTREETEIVRAAGDTALSFPIALGGIAILAPETAPVDSLTLQVLRSWIQAGRAEGGRFADGDTFHLYAADPNLGLWDALMEELDLSEAGVRSVTWLASDSEVATAVSHDPIALGVASILALPQDLERIGVRQVRITRNTIDAPAVPGQVEIATGEYPLYHYLYVACRPGGGVLASGFVSFLYSGRGQRLVAREGYLPARDVPREVQLTRRPITTTG
jgi:phosphate transport system substrate-binding protein